MPLIIDILHGLHQNRQDYGISRAGATGFFTDARKVHLADFRFRLNERFLYEYDFGDLWQHEVRIERRLHIDGKRTYPVCVGGKRTAPPEDCGGPLSFMEKRERIPQEVDARMWQIVEDVETGEIKVARGRLEEFLPLREWLRLDKFDRRAVNCRLKQYVNGDEQWLSQ